MNKDKNKLLLALGLTFTFTISNAETFTIRHNSCSSAPLSYKVLRSKKSIKIVDYTYNNKGVNLESGIVNEFSEKQITLDNSNGKVQVIITNNVAGDGKEYLLEYFFNQKVYCISLEKKKCYSMPEEFFKSQKTTSSYGIQWICANKAGSQKSNTVVPSSESKVIYVGTNTTVVGNSLKPIYESNVKIPTNTDSIR